MEVKVRAKTTCRFFFVYTGCVYGNRCKFRHTANEEKMTCKFYSSRKGCQRSDEECLYSHSLVGNLSIYVPIAYITIVILTPGGLPRDRRFLIESNNGYNLKLTEPIRYSPVETTSTRLQHVFTSLTRVEVVKSKEIIRESWRQTQFTILKIGLLSRMVSKHLNTDIIGILKRFLLLVSPPLEFKHDQYKFSDYPLLYNSNQK